MPQTFNEELVHAAVLLNQGDYNGAAADLFAAATTILAMLADRKQVSRATADSLIDETLTTVRASYVNMTENCK